MAITLILNRSEIGMLCSAISWTLHVSFSKTVAPHFDSDSVVLLEDAFASLNAAFHDASSHVAIEGNRLQIANADQSCSANLADIVTCLRAMDAEIGHSPTEVRIVANEDAEVLYSLLKKLDPLVA
jgi:hypothetical protein